MPSSLEKDTARRIVGLGNPLLDICANVTDEFLKQYELKLDNAILAEERHLKLYDEMMQMPEVELVAGGATQNSIRVAQWMLAEGYPGTTSFLGCVGADEYGDKLYECATKDGVDVHYLKDESTATGTCAVCIKGGERSLVANLAAANNYKIEHLDDEKTKQLIRDGELFYSAGFHLTVCPQAMDRLARHAVEFNKVFCMNLSAPFIMQVFKEPLIALIPYCDYVFGNETEAVEFGKMQGWGEDIEEIAQKLSQLPKASGSRCRTVVFTQGSKPTIVFAEGKLLQFAVPVIASSDVVDTNGAGDAFVGAFLSQLSLRRSLHSCVHAGHWAAQVIIRQSGCTLPPSCNYKPE